MSNAPALEERYDPELVAQVLSTHPFVTIEGISNVRTLGSYPTTHKDADGKYLMTRPNFLFRSAEVSGITEAGKTQMRDLNIRKIFDLRSEVEMNRNKTYIPDIKDVDIMWTPVFKDKDFSDTAMVEKFKNYSSDNVEAFMEQYRAILNGAGPAYGKILRHVRDKPQEGCLFHCTAGKDRTGLIAAILFKLAGVDDDDIVEDYHLTEIGRVPDREKIMHRLKKYQYFVENHDRALNMLLAKPEVMREFLILLQTEYGGAEAYVKRYCGMTDDDITVVRRNLLTTSSRL